MIVICFLLLRGSHAAVGSDAQLNVHVESIGNSYVVTSNSSIDVGNGTLKIDPNCTNKLMTDKSCLAETILNFHFGLLPNNNSVILEYGNRLAIRANRTTGICSLPIGLRKLRKPCVQQWVQKGSSVLMHTPETAIANAIKLTYNHSKKGWENDTVAMSDHRCCKDNRRFWGVVYETAPGLLFSSATMLVLVIRNCQECQLRKQVVIKPQKIMISAWRLHTFPRSWNLTFELTAKATTAAERISGPLCNDSLQVNDTIRSTILRLHKDSSLLTLSGKVHKKPWISHAGMTRVKYDCGLEDYAVRDSRWCKPYELKRPACVEVLKTKIPMAQVHTALSAVKKAVAIWLLNPPAYEDRKYGPFLRMLNGWKTVVGCAVNGCGKHGGYWNVICRYATRCTLKSRKLYTCFNGERCKKHKRPQKKKKLSPFGTDKFIVNFTGGFVQLLD